MGEVVLAPGVHGTLFDTPGGVYIPTISADEPGSGGVGRHLDALPKGRAIEFPTVLSAKLRGMLLRRGYVEIVEHSEEFGDVEILVRRPQ